MSLTRNKTFWHKAREFPEVKVHNYYWVTANPVWMIYTNFVQYILFFLFQEKVKLLVYWIYPVVFQEGLVYAVEFSHRSGRDLLNVAKKRTNIIPIIEDARHPHKYRMLVGIVDAIFADVAQPDQARIVAINAHSFLKNGGHFVISIKVSYYFKC